MDHSQRLHGLDFLRALMMLLGIVIHGGQIYSTMNLGFDYYMDPMKSPVLDAAVIFINTFRMPVFFLLSGFFTAMIFQRSSLPDMLADRYRRLVIPFLVFLPPLALVLGVLYVGSSTLAATGSWGLDLAYVAHPDLLWDNTHHLWFIYYLCIIIALAALLLAVGKRMPGGPGLWIAALLRLLFCRGLASLMLLGVILGLLALESYTGRLGAGMRWAVYWPSLVFFGVFFALGWFLWYQRSQLDLLARRGWWYLGVALVCLVIGLYCFLNQGQPGSETYRALHPVLALANAYSVVFFTVSLTGLFYRYFTTYSPVFRYLVDASYWVFLVHQPLVVAIAVAMHALVMPAELKFLINATLTTGLCLASYHYLVRGRVIDRVLRGEIRNHRRVEDR